jgi:hypothetical protein
MDDSARAPDTSAPDRADLSLLAFAGLAWIVAALHFGWLGLHYVPRHAAILHGFGVAELPFFARLVYVTPHHPLRGLPLAILAAPFLGLVLFPVAMRLTRLTWWSPQRNVRTLAVLLLLGASATVLASFAAVHSMHSVYQRLALESLEKH